MTEVTPTTTPEAERATVEQRHRPADAHDDRSMMQVAARDVGQAHQQPAPLVDEVIPEFFPPLVMGGVATGGRAGRRRGDPAGGP